jgi:HTH-type transcriptional repressor of NAD biosynthesis genes
MKKPKGFLIGKFMPPHAGHMYLFDRALEQVEELTVLVFWKAHEPIPGPQRMDWLRAMRPDITFVECTATHKIDYNDPTLWDVWMRSIRETYSETPDIVFSSEGYGQELAQRLNAEYVSIDPERSVVPISASAIRVAPWAHWQYIPEIVRPYFVQPVCIVGGESTGKTTLAHALARHFDTNCVVEYAREFLEASNHVCKPEDMPKIAAEQAQREDLAKQDSNRFLFCDTNAIVTKLWSQHYFGAVTPQVQDLVVNRPYSFYLLAKPDIDWVDDGMRDTPHARDWFYDSAKAELEKLGAPYGEVSGSGDARTRNAINHIVTHFGL